MTIEELQVILTRNPSEVVKGLQVTSFPNLPKWSDMIKQYDPMKHKIWDTTTYPEKKNENDVDDFKRTAFGLQKLAVGRLAQMMFAFPVQRIYNYDTESQSQQRAVDILEEVYRTRNFIDSENVERAKALNASCEMATVWWVYEREDFVEGEVLKEKLTHKTYSPFTDHKLYPITDDNGEMLVLSIHQVNADNSETQTVYIAQPTPEVRVFKKTDDWAEILEKRQTLEFFPVVYSNIKETVWNGDEGTNLVEQLEEMESFEGMYIKRNATPTFVIDYGDIVGGIQSSNVEKSDDARRFIRVGKGGSVNDVTWAGATEAIEKRFKRIRNAFFEQVQIPDISFANLLNSNTSADNKELVFTDAKAKAEDLGGEWERLFFQEIEIVKNFLKIMVPSIANDLDQISVRSQVRPYSVKTKKELAEYIATGGDAMSLKTKVSILGEVDDVNHEVDTIQAENNTQSNQLL